MCHINEFIVINVNKKVIFAMSHFLLIAVFTHGGID